LFKARADDRASLLQTLFLDVFRLATVVGGNAILSSLGLLGFRSRASNTHMQRICCS
jgi:hypothetical protein